MQIVDITIYYTDEEKEAVKEEYEARNLMDDKENEMILLGKEWNNHVKGNHTDVYSPIGFTALATILWLVTAFFLSQGFFSFFALVTSSPLFALIATGVAVYFWVRYAKQNKAYREKEEELDKKRDKAFREYQKLKEIHSEKLKIVESIVYRKTIEQREEDERRMNDYSFEELLKKE